MAVEDHPKFDEWLAAFGLRNEAESRYIRARMEKSPALETYRSDLANAQKAYDKICDYL